MYRAVRFGVYVCTLALATCALPGQVFGDYTPADGIFDNIGAEKNIVVLNANDPEPVYAERLETIQLTSDKPDENVSYSKLLASAKEIAKKTKANIIKINEMKARSKANICDHIVATLYKAENPRAYETEFSWTADRKLNWDDFRGPVQPYSTENIAAATFCAIGFETNTVTLENQKLKVNVFNTFYTRKSWVRDEEKNPNILAHEQGHFDLCELYTRKLRERMADINVDIHSLRAKLKGIYAQLQKEYQERQQLYEDETNHGLIYNEQDRWQNMITLELEQMEKWKES
jgi:hypothetical protein